VQTWQQYFVILRRMTDTIARYQHNPALTDTVGFFDYCIPLTHEWAFPKSDSMVKYQLPEVYNYITPPPPKKSITEVPSMFGAHNLLVKNYRSAPGQTLSTDWITFLFITCMVVFAWIQTSYAKRFGQIIRSILQPHYINQLEREGNLLRERVSFGLGYIYFITASIFIMQISLHFFVATPYKGYAVFSVIIIAGLLLYQFLKSFLVRLAGNIFLTVEYARAYSLNTMIFNHVTGILLLPLTFFTFYFDQPVLLIIAIVIVSLLMIYRTIRGILTGLSNKSYNLFYLFLYLCTLEILPLVLILKILSKL
jgi:hypothetical protein